MFSEQYIKLATIMSPYWHYPCHCPSALDHASLMSSWFFPFILALHHVSLLWFCFVLSCSWLSFVLLLFSLLKMSLTFPTPALPPLWTMYILTQTNRFGWQWCELIRLETKHRGWIMGGWCDKCDSMGGSCNEVRQMLWCDSYKLLKNSELFSTLSTIYGWEWD